MSSKNKSYDGIILLGIEEHNNSIETSPLFKIPEEVTGQSGIYVFEPRHSSKIKTKGNFLSIKVHPNESTLINTLSCLCITQDILPNRVLSAEEWKENRILYQIEHNDEGNRRMKSLFLALIKDPNLSYARAQYKAQKIAKRNLAMLTQTGRGHLHLGSECMREDTISVRFLYDNKGNIFYISNSFSKEDFSVNEKLNEGQINFRVDREDEWRTYISRFDFEGLRASRELRDTMEETKDKYNSRSR